MGSMYGVFTFIYHKDQPNVGKYTIPMTPIGVVYHLSKVLSVDSEKVLNMREY